MNIKDLQAELNAIDQEAAQTKSSAEQSVFQKLLNIIERLAGENDSLKSDLQNLSDEINRLKGEQGKPTIKANKKKDGDISSKSERKEAEANAHTEAENSSGEGNKHADGKKKRRRDSKLPKIKIDREQFCPLVKTGLPDDLEFKGYEDVVIQDLLIQTDNVKYRREIYYSPSQRKSYRGELPVEVRDQGEYGTTQI